MSDFDLLESGSGPVEPLSQLTPDRTDPEPASGPGVLVDVLPPNARILVTTQHSCYRFVVLEGPDRLVRVTGGKLFPDATEMLLEGATTDAGMIKRGWICAGMPIVLSTGVRRIITSRVESVAFERVRAA
jgi:hypothetical protein